MALHALQDGMAPNLGAGEQDSGDGNIEKVLAMVWQNHRSAAHDGERSADAFRLCLGALWGAS